MNPDILKQLLQLVRADQAELKLIKKSIDYIEEKTRQYGKNIDVLIQRSANIQTAIDAIIEQSTDPTAHSLQPTASDLPQEVVDD